MNYLSACYHRKSPVASYYLSGSPSRYFIPFVDSNVDFYPVVQNCKKNKSLESCEKFGVMDCPLPHKEA